MFNFGDDDKEKLKENMEDIKDMVNQGKQIGADQPPQEDSQESFQDPGLENAEPENQVQDPQDNTQSFETQESQPAQSFNDNQASQFDGPESSPQDEQLEEELESFEEKFGGKEQPQPSGNQQVSGDQRPEPAEEQRRSRSEKSGVKDSRDVNSLSQEVPSPPETREIDVPEIDRGPLFLRQQKFRRAKQLIDEMLYISSEVENTVNSLEAGIQEDQATERDIREMLKELEGGRGDVEDIISPREE